MPFSFFSIGTIYYLTKHFLQETKLQYFYHSFSKNDLQVDLLWVFRHVRMIKCCTYFQGTKLPRTLMYSINIYLQSNGQKPLPMYLGLKKKQCVSRNRISHCVSDQNKRLSGFFQKYRISYFVFNFVFRSHC